MKQKMRFFLLGIVLIGPLLQENMVYGEGPCARALLPPPVINQPVWAGGEVTGTYVVLPRFDPAAVRVNDQMILSVERGRGKYDLIIGGIANGVFRFPRFDPPSRMEVGDKLRAVLVHNEFNARGVVEVTCSDYSPEVIVLQPLPLQGFREDPRDAFRQQQKIPRPGQGGIPFGR